MPGPQSVNSGVRERRRWAMTLRIVPAEERAARLRD